MAAVDTSMMAMVLATGSSSPACDVIMPLIACSTMSTPGSCDSGPPSP